MLAEWVLLILSGIFLGAFMGVTTFLLIFISSMYIFNRADSDITVFVTLIVIVFMLFAYYGFSLVNFLEAAQPLDTPAVESVVRVAPFIVAHIAFVTFAYLGTHLGKFVFSKKLLGN